MPLFGATRPKSVTRTYGWGSFLAVVSLPVSWLMASRGMDGWRERAARDAEKGAVEMIRRGYRIVSAEEHSVPAFGIYWQKVTYELDEPAA